MSLKNKKTGLILIYCAIFVVVMGATIGLLFLYGRNNKDASSESVVSISASETVDQIVAKPSEVLKNIPALRPLPSEAALLVKTDQASYSVLVPSQAVVTYSSKEPNVLSGAATIASDAEALLTQLGFRKQSAEDLITTYKNNTTTCQVRIQKDTILVVSYACVANEKINEEYTAVKKLIALYDAKVDSDKKIVNPKQVARTTLQKDAVTGAVLSVEYDKEGEQAKGGAYLFGAIDGTWEYVADISTGTNTGKATVPEKSKAAILDAKWNGVLVQLTGLGG
jgi:hypothetical protein